MPEIQGMTGGSFLAPTETEVDNRQVVIGIAGKMQTGKDLLGLFISRRYYVQTLKIAGALKGMAFHVDPYVWYPSLDAATRALLQEAGTSIPNYIKQPTLWIDTLIAYIRHRADYLKAAPPYVITDVRFPHEEKRLREEFQDKFVLIRVRRTSEKPDPFATTDDRDWVNEALRTHISETSVDALSPDLDVYNDVENGNPSPMFYAVARYLWERLRWRPSRMFPIYISYNVTDIYNPNNMNYYHQLVELVHFLNNGYYRVVNANSILDLFKNCDKYYNHVLTAKSDDEMERVGTAPSHIYIEDTWSLTMSGLVVAFLTSSSIGAGVEMHLAKMLGIPIIVITDNPRIYVHPFIRVLANRVFMTSEMTEACEFIDRLSGHSVVKKFDREFAQP